jgi:putative sigma-54 modulation protein
MQTSITARHFTMTDQLKDFISERLTKLERFSHYIISAEVILSKEAGLEEAEGKLHLKHELLTAKAAAKDPFLATSEVIERLLIQIKRHDERMRDRKKNNHERAPVETVKSSEQ